jgi:general secretion pathway protein B
MSYILDALKKAEAEQDPDLRTSLAVDQQNQRRSRFGQYLIVAALLGNLLVLIWLFGPFSPDTTDQSPASADKAPAANGQSAAAKAPAANRQPAAANEEPATDEQTGLTTTDQTTPSARSEPSPPRPVETIHTNLAGLPAPARSRFPELSFSTHLYASDPDMRAVVIDGDRLTEGDRYGDLVLTNITETGVVFRFENYLVAVSVLDDWE